MARAAGKRFVAWMIEGGQSESRRTAAMGAIRLARRQHRGLRLRLPPELGVIGPIRSTTAVE